MTTEMQWICFKHAALFRYEQDCLSPVGRANAL